VFQRPAKRTNEKQFNKLAILFPEATIQPFLIALALRSLLSLAPLSLTEIGRVLDLRTEQVALTVVPFPQYCRGSILL
jgi:hypothetical protein